MRTEEQLCTTSAGLEIPLAREQVTAANDLYWGYLHGWQLCDRVLRALHEHFPNNSDPECVLPKAATLNQLYATRVFDIARIAAHVSEVLQQEPSLPDLPVVERIAWLAGVGRKDKGMHFRSFASKYCRFFISADRFPILDSFAGDALTYHLGQRGRSHYRRKPFSYLTYVADVNRLRETAGLDCSYVETDRYLWLRGRRERLKRDVRAGKRVVVKGEVQRLLEAPGARAAELLRLAFPE